jgi:hypothetical protein
MAVVGPAESAPLRPSLIVSVARAIPTDEPDRLLRELAEAGRPTDGVDARESLIESSSDSATGGRHLCHVTTFEEHDDGARVRRMRCLVYVHGDLMAHVVTVIGSASPNDRDGLDALASIFDTLVIEQPSAHRSGASTDG